MVSWKIVLLSGGSETLDMLINLSVFISNQNFCDTVQIIDVGDEKTEVQTGDELCPGLQRVRMLLQESSNIVLSVWEHIICLQLFSGLFYCISLLICSFARITFS